METWTLRFTDWDPSEETLRETLMTLGNGYFATRGSAEEAQAGQFNYPGTYISGAYNRLESTLAGKTIQNEDLVNWPNWTSLKFRHPGEDWFNLKQVKILNYLLELDMKSGTLTRMVHFLDKVGRETKFLSIRFVSMDNPHVGAMKFEIEAVNWSSKLEMLSIIDGSVKNNGVRRYKDLNNTHFLIKRKNWISDSICILDTMTTQSQLHVSQSIRTEFFENEKILKIPSTPYDDADQVGFMYAIDIRQGFKISIEKATALFTSRDNAINHPTYEAEKLIARLPSFAMLQERHARQWSLIWGRCDINLPVKIRETRLLRLHIFHLLQTVSLNSIDLDVGVPARGLHGEAYRGHIFWDEIFILPFLNLRVPELSRSLLMYRYRRLGEARVNAKKNGFKGALYPWQSGSNGEEESQVVHLNPLSGRWVDDATVRQRHINGAILYNIWQYFQATEDKDFLFHFGIEMAVEICRFWESALVFNPQKERYEILNVVGPDEFHTRYPGSNEAGINNNAYTNYMASWSFRTTIEILLSLSEDQQGDILNLLDLSRHTLGRWQDLSRKIYMPLGKDGIMGQFEGFEDLKDLDWNAYKKKYGNIQRIDRILELEGDDVNRYKINKQSDVLMLYYLFPEEELRSGFDWLGYPFEPAWISKNIEYHLNLSSNGSTLSRIVHSWVLSKYDIEKSWVWFNRALETDVADLQGGTSHEGIHLGAMAGTVDLVQRCFTGLEVRQDVLWITPRIPKELTDVEFLIHFRGHSIHLSLRDGILDIKIKRSWIQKGKLGIHGTEYALKQGDELKFSINKNTGSILDKI